MAIKSRGSRYSIYLNKVAEFYQKKQAKVYTNLILSLFTASFFAFFAIKPTITIVASLTKEIKDQKEIVTRLEKKIKNLNSAQKEYSSIKSKLHLIDTFLPQTPQLSLFLGQVEVLALENHLNLGNIQVEKIALKGIKKLPKKEKKGQEKSLYPTLDATLSLSGTYQEIENFLKSITNLRRALNVKNFSIAKKKKSSSESLELTLKVETFYLEE